MQDPRIVAGIEALRRRCGNTRELYHEACALLFFEHGITPTANRLYQYVRKGSMSTPAQVLSDWDELRDRTRVRIDQPELPEDLREAAGDLVLQLWGRAQRAAAEGLAARASEVERLMAQMRTEAELAQARADGLEAELEAARAALTLAESALGRARDDAIDGGRELATIRGRLASMGEMLVDQGEEMRLLRAELAAVRSAAARASAAPAGGKAARDGGAGPLRARAARRTRPLTS
jgi:hypothetical protein